MYIGISVVMLGVVSSVESQVAACCSSRSFGRGSCGGWLRVDGPLEESGTAALVQVDGSVEESQIAALKWLALWKRGQQQLGLEDWSTLRKRVRQQFLSTNPTIADTLRPSSMLNIDL